LLAAGVARVYTPKDFRLGDIVADIADLALAARQDQARDPHAPAADRR
jgi:hypothetical protein